MKMSLRCLAAAALALGLTAAPCRADFGYGVTFLDNQLISIDTTTGAGTLIGPLSTPLNPFGLAAVGDSLYTFDSVNDVITQLDPATGSTLKTFNVGIGPVLGQGGLAFQSSTVGYLTSALDPTTLNPANDLYRFDLSTGTSTLVAHTVPTLESLAFGPNGTLYGLGKLDGNLYTINPTTGATTLVGNTGVAVGSPVGALNFDSRGTLYASLDDVLYTLNKANGLATPVNSDPTASVGFSSISGIAFIKAVPEPGSVLLLAVGALGARLIRRRRR